MRILGMDTTRAFLTLVLVDGDSTYTKTVRENNKKHAALLMTAIDELLEGHSLTVSDIDCFSAVTGPGSFTGIRVGVATANALAFALKKPLLDINSLQLIAYNKDSGYALIDALHGNCYGGKISEGAITHATFFEADSIPDDVQYRQNPDDDYSEAYAALLRQGFKSGAFVSSLRPLYLRLSQAEREAQNA